MTTNFQSFPAVLTERKQWITWTLTTEGRKLPNGKSNDPSTWHNFEDVQNEDRIAYVFDASDPFVGIDLDKCIDDEGEYNEVATYCLELFKGKAYGEVSQSGRGLHFIVKGKKPDWAVCNRNGVECYEQKRFWVMTGKVIPGYEDVQDCQNELEQFLRKYLSKPPQQAAEAKPPAKASSKRRKGVLGLRERMEQYASKVTPASQGERNNACFRLAGNLWSIVDDTEQRPSREDVLSVVQSWNQSNTPPLDDNELCEVVDNARVKGSPPSPKPPTLMESTSTATILSKYHPKALQDPTNKNWIAEITQQTDNELALKFIGKYAERLRFIPEWKKWLVWDGKRWAIDHASNRTLRCARLFTRSLWDRIGNLYASDSVSRDDIDDAIKFVKDANSKQVMKAFIDLAAADRRVVVDAKMFNTSPLLLNLLNGTLDLETGQLREHRQSDCITQLAGVSFDPAATCPRWDDALRMIFAGDVEVIRYVQQVLGYAISGLQSEHILPIAYGSGCNGKSMVTNLMFKILGDYGYLANESLVLGNGQKHETEKAALFQRRFVAISEPGQGSQLKESRVKELTGDALINCRRTFEDFWTFERTHTFWMSTNHLPKIAGNDEGIWRRVKLIPFEVDLRSVTKPIPDFDRVLFEEEGSGILNWLLRGFLDWKQNGFIVPEKVRVAIDDYRQEEDVLTAFLKERCIVGKTWQATATELYEAYKGFASDKGEVLSITLFGRQMVCRGFEKRKPTAGEFRRKTLYLGIGLRDDESDSTLE